MPLDPEANQAAIFILKALLQGKDPESGRPLHANEVIHRPEVVRSLQLALKTLAGPERKPNKPIPSAARPKAKSPDRAGQGWDKTDDAELRALFQQRRTVRDIATALGRTAGAISTRLERLGLVQPRQSQG